MLSNKQLRKWKRDALERIHNVTRLPKPLNSEQNVIVRSNENLLKVISDYQDVIKAMEVVGYIYDDKRGFYVKKS